MPIQTLPTMCWLHYPLTVAAEHIWGWGGAGVASQYGHEVRRFLHYVTPSTEKRSRGTLGYV